MATSNGPRTVPLRGKADRVDLLEDGTFRLIDYKLGWPPNRARALQLPIYSICAEQQLASHRGRNWTLGEAAYLAFKGPRRVVPLFSSAADRNKVLAEAQQRLVDTLDHFGIGFSWGGFESLALPIDPARVRTACPWTLPGKLIRLQIGLEDPADLIADLARGLAAAAQ